MKATVDLFPVFNVPTWLTTTSPPPLPSLPPSVPPPLSTRVLLTCFFCNTRKKCFSVNFLASVLAALPYFLIEVVKAASTPPTSLAPRYHTHTRAHTPSCSSHLLCHKLGDMLTCGGRIISQSDFLQLLPHPRLPPSPPHRSLRLFSTAWNGSHGNLISCFFFPLALEYTHRCNGRRRLFSDYDLHMLRSDESDGAQRRWRTRIYSS